jgi:predicted metal-dependent hydrolase
METIQYGTRTISFTIQRANRKTLGIEVHPDLSIWAIAPENATIDAIRLKIIKRAAWIVKQQGFFQQFLPRVPERQYVPGETHSYLGRRYVLKIRKESKNDVKLKGSELIVFSPDDLAPSEVQNLLTAWYYQHARRVFEQKIDKALKLFRKHNIKRPEFEIRRMKNRWGSCTPQGKILLNPELIKALGACIDYVIIHELCHLIYPSHSDEFYRLQESLNPDWKKWKNKLEHINS